MKMIICFLCAVLLFGIIPNHNAKANLLDSKKVIIQEEKEMTQTYKVQVSMNQAHIVESGFVWKQGDFGFNIEIEVLDFDTTGATPQIIFRKSTGAVEATEITRADNKFTYAIRGTELDTPGPCVCDLKLNDSTTKRVSTASFKYFVIPDTMDGLEQEASSYSDTIAQIVSGFDGEIESLSDGIENIYIQANGNNGNQMLVFHDNQFIANNVDIGAEVPMEPIDHTAFDYAISDCQPGDIFTISGTGGGSARLWSFVDSNNLLLSKSSAYVTETNKILVAPTNASKFIINAKNGMAIKGYTTIKRITDAENNISSIIANEAALQNSFDDLYKDVIGFNTISFTDGKIIYTNGDIGSTMSTTKVSLAGWRCADFSVTPGDIIILNVKGGNGPRAWAFGDADGKLISHADSGVIAKNLVLVAPADAVRIVINDENTGSTSFFGESVPKMIEAATNAVLEIVDATITYIDAGSGEAVKDCYQGYEHVERNYWTARKYDVNGAKYAQIYMAPSQYLNIYTFLDKNENVLTYKSSNSDGELQYFETVIPDGATTLYVCTLRNFNDIVVKFAGGKYVDNVIEKTTEKTKLSPQVLPSNVVLGWFNGNTKITSYGYSKLYRVYDLDSVTIEEWPKGNYYNSYTFTDENDNVLKKEQSSSSFSEAVTYKNVTIPDGATKLYVTDKYVNAGNAGATITVYGNLLKEIDDFRGNYNYFLGKKIVWYGTSIPAAGYISRGNTNGYPYRVGRILGANVINESVGSSCIHCKVESMISESNPYGFNGNYTKCSECLTNTVEEMQWIIDNWDSDIWIYNKRTTAPDATLQAEILSFSYENRIDQYLSEGNEPDYWIFDHGKNDAPEDGTYDPQDPYSLYSTRGAFNFLIKHILEYNPKSRILLIGHYENQLYPSVSEIQKAVANDWLIPLMPLWEYLGWSQKTVHTTGDWVNGYWDANAVPQGHDMTMLNIALPDNLHPHTDLSGNTLEYEARHIAKWLLNYAKQEL